MVTSFGWAGFTSLASRGAERGGMDMKALLIVITAVARGFQVARDGDRLTGRMVAKRTAVIHPPGMVLPSPPPEGPMTTVSMPALASKAESIQGVSPK